MEMWEAEIEYWRRRMNDTHIHLSDDELEAIDRFLTPDEIAQVMKRKGELESENEWILNGDRQNRISQKSVHLVQLIKNIVDARDIHLKIMKKYMGLYSEHRHWIVKEMDVALQFFNEMPAEEKKFWKPPVMGGPDGKWMEQLPEGPLDRWTVVRPSVISPFAKAILELLERKLKA